MDQSETKSALTWIFGIVLFSILLAFFIVAFIHVFKNDRSTQTAVTAPSGNFSRMICDNAYQTEMHYDNDNPPFIDFKLKEGCFSGFITMPKAWRSWQGQMLDNDPTDWEALWASGVQEPYGPWSATQINSGKIQNVSMPEKKMRLEGKGTVRFYPTVNDANTTPPAESERPANGSAKRVAGTEAAVPAAPLPPQLPRHHIPPAKGANPEYDIFIEQCVHNGERIDCWGLVTNKIADESVGLSLADSDAVDDMGNSSRSEIDYGPHPGPFMPQKDLIPGRPTKFFIKVYDAHIGVKSLAFNITTRWRGSDNKYYFPDVPVEQ